MGVLFLPMAENKKTFIFYSDWVNMIREMPDEDAGQLLKHILSYVNDENPETKNILVRMAFGHMKPLLKADLQRWDVIREKRKKAGRKGGQANAKQNKANAKQVEAVNDNVNVNVNDNVIDNDIKECYEKILSYFPEHLQPSKQNIENNWLDTIEKLNRIDGLKLCDIELIVKKTREDDFWSRQFLSLTKLRKKNKDGVMYYQVFIEQFKNNHNGSKQKGASAEAITQSYLKHFGPSE